MSASSKFFSNTSAQVTGRIKYWMKHHPIITNSFLCLNLWIAGDFTAQYSEIKYLHTTPTAVAPDTGNDDSDNDQHHHQQQQKQKHEPYVQRQQASFWEQVDIARTAKCAGYGATVTGPLLATWYPFLERLCVQNNIVARYGLWGAPILKVLADEFIMDPPCLFLFYGYMNVCEGGTMESFRNKLQTQFWPSWMASLAVWPIVLLGTFRFVPIYAHAPVINACCIVWDAFLSHRNTLSKAVVLVPERKKVETTTSPSPPRPSVHEDDPESNIRIA